MKVYIVTSGEYSDYHIERVFDSREKAERFISNNINNERSMIEEFEVNTESQKEGSRLIRFLVEMDKDGNTNDWIIYNYDDYFKTDGTDDYIDDNILHCHVKAKNEKHAIKICNERRIQRKANNEFI